MSQFPTHDHANAILAHWPDRKAAAKTAEEIPEPYRSEAKRMARRVWANWNGRGPGRRWYVYEAWTTVRINPADAC